MGTPVFIHLFIYETDTAISSQSVNYERVSVLLSLVSLSLFPRDHLGVSLSHITASYEHCPFLNLPFLANFYKITGMSGTYYYYYQVLTNLPICNLFFAILCNLFFVNIVDLFFTLIFKKKKKFQKFSKKKNFQKFSKKKKKFSKIFKKKKFLL